ncbi:MAG TPA: prenyltransferase/squalene oxidase repeat-containing protein [Solirubrobacteraceae bacterium]|nr:prenyltransferase/squalene oxidase repeat-containing protein [Solirubrobacteraceae bacterium]
MRFLQEAQNSNGGFGGEAGEESSQLFSAWVALALAAASINPQDQAKPGGASVYTYLAEHVAKAIRSELCAPVICTTAFERELLIVDASGTSPESFGGVDLVSELLARKLPDGSFPFVPGGHGEVNDTIFAILSLSPIKEPAVQEVVEHAAEWVIQQQNTDGSWAWQNKGSPGESDMTGAAIEALNAAGMSNTEAQQKAIKYLHEVQEPDGGFPEFPSEGESNSGSTAWATQGIWAAGEDPEAPSWVQPSSGHGPLDYLESMQQLDGHIRYRKSEELNGVWMTAYAGPAYAGQSLPVPPPPRNPEAPTPPIAPAQGGGGTQSGSGVIAGGGGLGAPLFSRPQPGSKGHTPGGVRQLKDQHHNVNEHRHNPGPPRKTPVPTATSASAHRHAGAHHPKRHDPATHKGSGGVAIAGTGAGGSAQASGGDVKGILIGAPAGTLQPGAPGLHSAGANRTSWLAIGIAGALLLCVLMGMQIELRRPEAIL